MILENISILSDNYVWFLYDTNNFCIIIDPGLSEPIIEKIKKKKWNPVAILLTHSHSDHTEGVSEIIQNYPSVTIFGPKETRKNSVNRIVSGGEKLFLLNKTVYVLPTPGHTLGHVSYYMKPYFFCGDTLFSGGCGRVYKERYLEMYNSIKLISSFPDNTMLCCSHEYTLSNLSFAKFILPEDNMIKIYYKKIKKLRYLNKSSLPCYIFFEKKINLFLRTDEKILKKFMGLKNSLTDLEVFIQLRLRKNYFIGAKRD
ncbi:hydroxyacylglutathione hydrolase [Buchnera aphidicola]|uniref:Hydroxyacylglutathione hydrolase n=1 Tax=Buchnera aphidicola str. USDA (Myzus persicae) TaxID=1009856 RepID=W0P3V9_BUCMP|nr:hydroxyacylglutathione hydrolase [Buchnera aphidicola]AHG60132.1 Glob [Buchnera aphidicola str. USDA (Myzus persicae)]AHG60712.1 Glob [Buchnera aphidicola str. W106 (Myzus persicae)]AHG61284.1 Glob [Buchnera aphidicola str. G002 (Myzus persicae)]AHG61857.1 Glob [Buchnera aphidicola str. F009 (Myzus persicae)]WAI03179.1 MAG: hydroxyacylglutathione hydrolase [Buchnera aphidicola (Myzus persicae)]